MQNSCMQANPNNQKIYFDLKGSLIDRQTNLTHTSKINYKSKYAVLKNQNKILKDFNFLHFNNLLKH